MAKITYKGITQNSSIEHKLTDTEWLSIREGYYQKPGIEVVKKQLKSIHNGGTKMDKIYEYYLKDIMSKCVGPGASWSIYDGLKYKPIVEYLIGKAYSSPKAYDVGVKPLCYSFARTLLTAGIRYCVRLPNFPIKTVDMILDKYCPKNGNWYDFSCGWAARMLGALHKGVNYYGTDPNYELCDILQTIAQDYRDVNNITNMPTILAHGSEIRNDDWESIMDLAFSSPPYFDVEDYKIGDQSWKPGVSYKEWVDDYVRPTIENIYFYLKQGGYFAVNVKNVKGRPDIDIEKTWCDIADKVGFTFIGIESRQNEHRPHGDTQTKLGNKKAYKQNNNEKIFIFQK